jgi:hypothetical protein
MYTPYRSPEQFRAKAALLAAELGLDGEEASKALAHISGYAQPSDIAVGARDTDLLSSREELMAKLQAIYPHVANDKAGMVIDKLGLPVRETDLVRVTQSPGAAPNISG